MSLQQVAVGRNVPDDINVIVEVPMNSPAIKYEVDKQSGAIFVDRMLKTAMYYPCNYGYVPHTLCGDGDPVDVLVVLRVAVTAPEETGKSIFKGRLAPVEKLSKSSV